MNACIRWGILGSGWIARQMAEALRVLPDAELIAIGSRSRDKAEAFGQEFDVPLRFDRYEDLVDSSDVDVVYIATPHSSHAHDATLALQAGKPVLCEKALTVNAREAEAVIAEARAGGLFLMEAMWSRFVPAMVKLREWMAAGVIGEIRHVSATIGWAREYEANSRLFDRGLAGGALLDIGVYPISLFSMLLGAPTKVAGVMHPAPNGVDAQCAGSLVYPSGALATFAASLSSDLPCDALVVGSEGRIRIHAPIVAPEALTRVTPDGGEETIQLPHLGNGYPHEVIEVMECLRAGKLESTVMPLDESLAIVQTMDTLREPWGLRYPGDDETGA